MKLKEVRIKDAVEMGMGTSLGRLSSGENEKKTNDRSYGWTLVAKPEWIEATNREGRLFIVHWLMVTKPPEVDVEAMTAPEPKQLPGKGKAA